MSLEQVARSYRSASLAQKAMTEAIIAFQAAAACRDWKLVEVRREEALGALDAYLDHFAAAHRALDG